MFHSYKILIITISFTAFSLGSNLAQTKEDGFKKNEWLFGIQDSKYLILFMEFLSEFLLEFPTGNPEDFRIPQPSASLTRKVKTY